MRKNGGRTRLIRWCAYLAAACVMWLSGAGAARAETPGLSALSAVLYEPQSGRVLYERDAYTPRPMASTTKIMTALLAVESGDGSRVVTVSDEAVRVEGSSLGLRAGDKITLRDLVIGLLLESGNDAANVIAYVVSGGLEPFAVLMNRRAAELGMEHTKFVTPSGLDAEGHASTAYDMALLAAAAMENPTVAAICAMESATVSFGNPPQKIHISNHNKLLQMYPHAVGIKTGFTKKSGRCLVSAAEKDGVRLIAVTLNAGDDWNDHMALFEYGFSRTESVRPTPPELPALPVTGGTTAEIALKAESPPPYTLLDGEDPAVREEILLPRFVIAPISEGDRVGRVAYYAGDRLLGMTDIVAAASVPARPGAGFLQRLWKNFGRLLAC